MSAAAGNPGGATPAGRDVRSEATGRRIRRRRQLEGIGRSTVAGVLGVSVATLGRIERDERDVSTFELALLHSVFGWDAAELLGLRGDW